MKTHFQIHTEDNSFSLSHGFLPDHDPYFCTDRRDSNQAWLHCAMELPKILGLTETREIIGALPAYNLNALQANTITETLRRHEQAMVTLSFLAHAYVWCDTESPASSLPSKLALPWYRIANQLGRPPVLSYASYALYNWRRLDANKPIELGNICLLQNFLGGLDEEWFILIHVDIEAKAIPALQALEPLVHAAEQNKVDQMHDQLQIIEAALHNINATMDRMPEKCDPHIYYNRVRPYIHGWKDNPALPNGLLYEGVEEYANQPMRFKGETGAQSTIVPCLDAVLGITHEDNPLRQHLDEMRDYMPPEHVLFLQHLEHLPSIRGTVLKTNDVSLKSRYNQCVSLLHYFRTAHFRYAADYINKQSPTSVANPADVGTGGTPFMQYLKKHLDETKQHLLE